MVIGILGAGAMGIGIAQVAATSGHEVRVYDASDKVRTQALTKVSDSLAKLLQKGRITPEESVAIMGRIYVGETYQILKDADLIIEAIVENLDIKKQVFKDLENIVSPNAIVATNTSSLSVTGLASALTDPTRFLGIHFFNPPVLMPLVEVIPAAQTTPEIVRKVQKLIISWGKTPVVAKDTPGFIVNKVARPFYSEAIRILEEGIADVRTIDEAMTEQGFRMGPFTLMDFIGHDVNYKVTESVWKAFYYDTKYRPSLTQLKLMEAGFLGKKSGKGFYDYSIETPVKGTDNPVLKADIFLRILSMLINEAADTVGQFICTEEDVELAVKLGVNYPKGLLEWGREIGIINVIETLDSLYNHYHEERYRVAPYLKRLLNNK